jgi:hypothetical protein
MNLTWLPNVATDGPMAWTVGRVTAIGLTVGMLLGMITAVLS